MDVCSSCGKQYAEEKDFLAGTSRWRFCEDGNLWFNCSCNNTMVILQGKFDWFSPDKVFDEDKASLFNKLSKKSKIPYIPSGVMKVQMLLSDENSCAQDFVNAVKGDPVLAAEILSHANNMKLGSRQSISSLSFAFSYIGRNAISEIVLLAAIKSFKFKTKKFKSEPFWADSLRVGSVTEFLSRKFPSDVEGDEAYLSGCLSHIGKIINAFISPVEVDDIYEKVRQRAGKWQDLEKDYGLYAYTTLGELAAVIWGLPPYIADSALYHLENPDLSRDSLNSGELAGLAHLLYQKHLNAEYPEDLERLALFAQKLHQNEDIWDTVISDMNLANP